MYGQNRAIVPVNQKNMVALTQISGYPVSDKIEISINPDKPETFTVAFRIPEWSANTLVTLNGSDVTAVTAGTYKKITRVWSKGDKVVMKLDLNGRLITLKGHQAILRGPLVLARDTRFADGYIYESAVVIGKDGQVDLIPSDKNPENVWMSFTAPLVLGTDLEGDFRNPKLVNLCDFASAGNTWREDSRYKVWIPMTLNVMRTDYKGY